MPAPAQQLDAIHAMLAAGHRNLRIERHSLLLWGLPAGLLFALSESILTPEQIPDTLQRALAWLALLAGVLLAVGALDWSWTRRVKAARDEAWSFVHRQVQKVWWLLMGLAALTTFAMFFFGGGYMVCTLWLVVAGLGLYLHGLFSEELLEWIGVTLILIGIGCLFAGLPFESMRWIASAVFAIGLPLLALMLDRGRHRAAAVRLGQLLFWLGAVLALPLWLERQAQAAPIEAPTISLDQFRAGALPAPAIAVRLPAGTSIPVDIEIAGDVFNGPAVLPLTLAQPLELLVRDGKLSGDARYPGEAWLPARQARWIQIPWLRAELDPNGGPRIRGQLIVQLHPQ